MKILVFNWRDIRHPEAGGAEVNIHEQAKRWVSWGHQVRFFTARPKGQRFRENIDGIDVYRAGGRFSVYIFAILAYIFILRRKTDVILDIENGIPFFTPLYSLKPKVCLILHIHQDQFLVELRPVLGRIGKFMERYLISLFYRRCPFVAISETTAKSIREDLKFSRGLHVRVIRPGVDRAEYSPGVEKFEEPTVLYLGRVKVYKRLPRLIAMMPTVRQQVPGARLLIAGSGDGLQEAMDTARRLKDGGLVRFLGQVSEGEKVRLFRGAWVLATPSMNEGWGITVMEANACGTPAVAYRVPGLSESISEGKSGLLSKNDTEFISNIAAILSDLELRQKLSSGAVKWAAGFDWDDTAQQMIDALEDAIPRRKHPRDMGVR